MFLKKNQTKNQQQEAAKQNRNRKKEAA